MSRSLEMRTRLLSTGQRTSGICTGTKGRLGRRESYAALSGIRFVPIPDATVNGTALSAMAIKLRMGFYFSIWLIMRLHAERGQERNIDIQTWLHIRSWRNTAHGACVFEACVFMKKRVGYAIESQRINSVQTFMWRSQNRALHSWLWQCPRSVEVRHTRVFSWSLAHSQSDASRRDHSQLKSPEVTFSARLGKDQRRSSVSEAPEGLHSGTLAASLALPPPSLAIYYLWAVRKRRWRGNDL